MSFAKLFEHLAQLSVTLIVAVVVLPYFFQPLVGLIVVIVIVVSEPNQDQVDR